MSIRSFNRRAKYLFFLISLMKMSEKKNYIVSTTKRIGKELGISQQTASLILKELEKMGFIEREILKREEKIKITSEGLRFIILSIGDFSTQDLLKIVEIKTVKVRGRVFSGKGEGAYYLSQKQYAKKIEEKLNFLPYPGTLNIKLSTYEDINKIEALYKRGGIKIEGFITHDRTFGDVYCYKASIENHEDIKCAIIRSERTSYDTSVVEIISDVYLRRELGLHDGSEIVLTFEV